MPTPPSLARRPAGNGSQSHNRGPAPIRHGVPSRAIWTRPRDDHGCSPRGGRRIPSPTMTAAYRLGVDFGTSTTVAMLQQPDGRTRPLLFDGSPLLSSAVLLGPDGRLHVGRDAAHLARSSPERLEPNPKRRIDDDTVLLGDVAVPVRDLLGAILRRAGSEANRVAGPIGDL